MELSNDKSQRLLDVVGLGRVAEVRRVTTADLCGEAWAVRTSRQDVLIYRHANPLAEDFDEGNAVATATLGEDAQPVTIMRQRVGGEYKQRAIHKFHAVFTLYVIGGLTVNDAVVTNRPGSEGHPLDKSAA